MKLTRKDLLLVALAFWLLVTGACELSSIAGKVCNDAGKCACPAGTYEGTDGLCYATDSTPDD